MICPSCKYEYVEKYKGGINTSYGSIYEKLKGDERPIELHVDVFVHHPYTHKVYLFACPKCNTVIMNNKINFEEK